MFEAFFGMLRGVVLLLRRLLLPTRPAGHRRRPIHAQAGQLLCWPTFCRGIRAAGRAPAREMAASHGAVGWARPR